MPNKDKSWLNDGCFHALILKHEAHLRWTSIAHELTGVSFSAARLGQNNEIYAEATRGFVPGTF